MSREFVYHLNFTNPSEESIGEGFMRVYNCGKHLHVEILFQLNNNSEEGWENCFNNIRKALSDIPEEAKKPSEKPPSDGINLN